MKCSALACSVTVLPDRRSMAVAADRADYDVVLVIAFSLRTESSKFESFGTDCRSRQPAMSLNGACKMSGMTAPS